MIRRYLTTVLLAVATLAVAAWPISAIHADSGPWHWIALLAGLALYAWLACGIGGLLWGAASERGRLAAADRRRAAERERLSAGRRQGPTTPGTTPDPATAARDRGLIAEALAGWDPNDDYRGQFDTAWADELAMAASSDAAAVP